MLLGVPALLGSWPLHRHSRQQLWALNHAASHDCPPFTLKDPHDLDPPG